jgi:hypothetical protein
MRLPIAGEGTPTLEVAAHRPRAANVVCVFGVEARRFAAALGEAAGLELKDDASPEGGPAVVVGAAFAAKARPRLSVAIGPLPGGRGVDPALHTLVAEANLHLLEPRLDVARALGRHLARLARGRND